MDRKETTKILSRCLEKHIKAYDTRVYWAKEVTFDYRTPSARRVDYMRYKPKKNGANIEMGLFYCYEIKSCVEDFHSKNGHNFFGEYNYYVMTKETYEKVQDEIPEYIGVYIKKGNDLKSVKKATRLHRRKTAGEMILMMFRSCARDRKMEVEEC